MSFITATKWVPRGAPAPFPRKYVVDDAELSRISELAKLQLEEAKQDLEAAETLNGTNKDAPVDGDVDMDRRSEGSESQVYVG